MIFSRGGHYIVAHIFPSGIFHIKQKVASSNLGGPILQIYEVDAMRARMVASGASVYGIFVDFAVLIGITVLLIIIASKLYPRVIV